MEIKLFEVRDRATFIACIAIRLSWRTDEEKFLLRRAGYAEDQIDPSWMLEPYVLFGPLAGSKLEYDPFAQSNRTMKSSHMHVIEHWASLTSGAVIDVEYINNESAAPKKSARFA